MNHVELTVDAYITLFKTFPNDVKNEIKKRLLKIPESTVIKTKKKEIKEFKIKPLAIQFGKKIYDREYFYENGR